MLADTDYPAAVIACFDLDGVLVDSEGLKIAAFRLAVQQVLAPPGEVLDAIDAYNRRNRGVLRREKFAVSTELATGRQDETAIRMLLDVYAALLAGGLSRVPPMPGALEFTQGWTGRRALVTSAPRDEAEEHLRRLGFPPFNDVFTAPTPKSVALRTLAGDGQVPVVFFGDAQADADAAAATSVAFVAVGQSHMDLRADVLLTAVESLADLRGKQRDVARMVLER